MTVVAQPDETPPARHGLAVWSDPAWRTVATDWLDEQLGAVDVERTGPVEQPHLRPWATALRAPTSRGPVWLKATSPATAAEIGLYEILSREAPSRVLAPLAVDRQRNWIVLPDGGPVLGDRLVGSSAAAGMADVVPYYAQFQLDLASSVDEMLAVGVPDMRPQMLPTRFLEALAAVKPYVDKTGNAVDLATYDELASTADHYDAVCEQLAAGPVPVSLQHDDLHPWNVFAQQYDTAPVFFDWGDSVVAHPFASMLVSLRVVKDLAKVPDDSPEVRRVRDAYLEPFTHLAPRRELLRQLELACQVGKVVRSLSWVRLAGSVATAGQEDYADAPLRWLSLLLQDSYLGRVGDDY